MQVTKNITLDLLETGSPVIIKAKQNDRNTRYIVAHLCVNRLAYPVPSGTEIAFRYKKPDGTAGFYDALPDNSPAITVSGNTVTVELVEQVLTVAGCVHCEINMYNAASEKLTTFTFEIAVEESVLTDAEIVSSDYYNVLTAEIAKALQAVTDATDQAENAAQSAQDAADSAAMSKDWAAGQPVTYSGTPVSIAYAGAQRIASITAYGETPQGGTTEAPVALTGVDSAILFEQHTPINLAKPIPGDFYGVSVITNADGSVTVKGTATNETWPRLVRVDIPSAIIAGYITISLSSPASVRVSFEAIKPDGRKESYTLSAGSTSMTVKIKSGYTRLHCFLSLLPDQTIDETFHIMIAQGIEPVPFVPYVEPSVTTLPIPRPLRRVGDVRDKCVTRVKSVYDKRVVLDGSENWIARNNTSHSFSVGLSVRSLKGLSDSYYSMRVNDIDVINGVYLLNTSSITITDLAHSTVEEFKAHLSEHPLTVYYQSTAYDGTNGLDVCLTEYQTGFVELDGTEAWQASSQTSGMFFITRDNISAAAAICSNFNFSKSATTEQGKFYIVSNQIRFLTSYETLESWKNYLAAQKAEGTPVQIAYQLATPEVYATDPIDFDNAAGPLTVLTGGEVEVRMTELVGTRSPELTGKMDRDIYFQVGNLNLGDNTNLLNPVNQQGQASYTGDSTSPYCIDRWRISNGTTYNIVSRTLTASSYANRACGMWQTNELAQQALAIGSTITFSGYINGMQHSGTIKILNRDLYSSFAEVPAGYECDDFEIVCCTASHEQSKYNLGIYPKKEAVLNWIKWEKGLYATPYAPKGFGLEQLECMRYYQTIKGIKYVLRKALASEGFPYVIPVTFMPMRAVPQTDITVTEGAENNLTATGVTQTACGIQFQPVAENVGLTFTLTLSANL